MFESNLIENSNEIDKLGVTYDKSLSYQTHIRQVTKKAAGKVSCLRRITWLVGSDALELLYNAQIRSTMEFAPLTWGGAAQTHLELLNKVQRRVERMVHGEEPESNFTSLQHRRDVAGLTTMYKIHEMDAEHLRPLRQPLRPVPRITRATSADSGRRCLQEMRCNTLHQQLQFIPKYTKLWNEFVVTVGANVFRNLQSFKCAAKKWLLERGSP